MDHAGRQHQTGAMGHAGRHRPWAILGHQQQASTRPAAWIRPGTSSGTPGERHQQHQAGTRPAPGQRQAGARDQAGTPGASSSRPGAIGHGPCSGTRPAPWITPGAMDHAGRQHQASTTPAPGQHQASTRPAPWVTPGASARPAGRAPSAMGHARAPGRRHESRWPGKPARRDAPSPAQRGRQGKPFSRPIPAPPVGDSKHCPREKAGGKGEEPRQKRVCMYEEISLFNKFSICPRYVPVLSPLCPR